MSKEKKSMYYFLVKHFDVTCQMKHYRGDESIRVHYNARHPQTAVYQYFKGSIRLPKP